MGYNIEVLPLALAGYAASAVIFVFRDRIARASNSYWSALRSPVFKEPSDQ